MMYITIVERKYHIPKITYTDQVFLFLTKEIKLVLVLLDQDIKK